MFLLVSVRHVVAHPDEHQHGVSIPISINLGKTFLRISRIRHIPLSWNLARVFAYLPPFISQILDFIYWTVLIFILIYFEWRELKTTNKISKPNLRSGVFFRCVSSASKQKGRRTTWSQVKPKHLCTLVKIAVWHISSEICHTATTRCNCTSLILNNKKAPANDKSNDIGADLFQVVSYYYVCRRSRNGRGRLLRRLGEKHDGKDRGKSPRCFPSHLPPRTSFMPIPPQYLIRRHRRQKNDWERVRPWLSPFNSW